MCCFFTTLVLFGPRLAILVWWLLDTLRWQATFETWLWPLLGFIFVPWTTLMYVLVWSPIDGIVGFDWIWLGLALFFDIASYGGSGWGNKERIGY